MLISDFIVENEQVVRLSFFLGVFAIMAIWEVMSPRRVLIVSKLVRWSHNLALVIINTIVLRLLFPAAAAGVALLSQEQGWGLLNYYQLPPLISIIVAIIALDFIIYLQHVVIHAIPVLWRLHRVHHADLDYDVTTGSRFHTMEIIISMLIKFAVIILLGAPVIAVILFEVILNAMAMFNHANIKLPKSLDNALRWLLVTPDMHRIHHSVEDDESNCNFGFNLSCWDRLFGTYREQPRGGQTGFTIGIHQYRDEKETNRIVGMLLMPFKGRINEYAINTRSWQAQENQLDIEQSKDKQ